MSRCLCGFVIVALMAQPLLAEAPMSSDAGNRSEAAEPTPVPEQTAAQSICLMVEAAARANDLPVAFFARVIWQESRFRPDEVGPQTRSGDHAEGIAQFMPKTAAERRLLNPFDPVQALPKSAEFLGELRAQFGNLGLAAAAYNAGPQRIRDWIAGRRPIPAETRNYVAAITGRSVDDWAAAGTTAADDIARNEGTTDCLQLVATLKRQPNLFVRELVRRVTLGVTRPWGVQLSAGFSRDQVLTSYASLAKRYGSMVGGSEPMIVQSIFRSRGTRAFYQVRIGLEARSNADALCARIQHAGGSCVVLRTPPTAS